ncbi:MAG: hypothetical protein IKM00_03545, partial [Clostridia bacterium]|nr:hypothetical protein [Clostridia bacterium]
MYSLDVINIVVVKQTNIIGIVISVERAFVKPNIPNATVNAEKNSFRFFIYHTSIFLFTVLFYRQFRLCITKAAGKAHTPKDAQN